VRAVSCKGWQMVWVALCVSICAACAACAALEPRRVPLATCLDNASACREGVLVTATVPELRTHWEALRGRLVEVSGPLGYFGQRGYWTWYLMLGGSTPIRCYTHHYRIEPGWDAQNLLYRVRAAGGQVTVVGVVRRDGIDIELLESGTEIVQPSYVPPRGWWPGHGWGL